MSVVESKRKTDVKFLVITNWYEIRKYITDLMLRDFGFKYQKRLKELSKKFGCVNYNNLSDELKESYDIQKHRYDSFQTWYIEYSRNTIMDVMRNINRNIFIANSVYPCHYEEYLERRLLQDRAIGLCYLLLQELQYIIETLPTDKNIIPSVVTKIEKEIALIKGWRKSDNKFKKIWVNSEGASNFANANDNRNNSGNANYNNASNTNTVRPDLDVSCQIKS